jgi:hypothetical protein
LKRLDQGVHIVDRRFNEFEVRLTRVLGESLERPRCAFPANLTDCADSGVPYFGVFVTGGLQQYR